MADEDSPVALDKPAIFSSIVIPCPHCESEVDLILQSSDGIQFAAHSLNLERYSEGFPPADFKDPTKQEVVELPENSRVVELMLQYMHLKPQPEIEDLTITVLEALANAVEKYFIYSAMVVCRMCMTEKVDIHPLNVLRYARKHGYKALANEAVGHTLGKEYTEMREFFGKDSNVPGIWLEYREQWMSAMCLIYSKNPPIANLHKGGFEDCELWRPFLEKIRRQVDCSAAQIAQFEVLVLKGINSELTSCKHCGDRARKWIIAVKSKIGDVSSFDSMY